MLCIENIGLLSASKDADTHFDSVGLGLGERVFSERICMSVEMCCLSMHHKVCEM